MRIATVIPCFNDEKNVKQAIESVLFQTRRPDLIVVVNDGSTDKSGEVIKSFLENPGWAKVIKYVELPQNSGIGAARQAGVEAVKDCDYVSFLSSDDYYYENAIEVFESTAAEHPGDVLYSDYTNVDENGNVHGQFYSPHFESRQDFVLSCWTWAENNDMFVNFSTLFVPRSVFDKVPVDKALRFGEDLAWLLKAMKDFNFRHLRQPTCFYRRHGGQTTSRVIRDIAGNNAKIREDCKKYWGLL